MNIVGIIPARWESTRFPGKPLALIAGKPLIQRVLEQTRKASSLTSLWVATDDKRIAEKVKDLGFKVIMTRSDHPTGTDRVAEAISGMKVDGVINIQGDEPLIDPKLIDQLSKNLADGHWDMVTAAVPLHDEDEIKNPSVVKVVMGQGGRALYFSRAVIPYVRDETLEKSARKALYFRHMGIYGYTKPFLEKMVHTNPPDLEKAEKLEQLRALHLGVNMKVLIAQKTSLGVDTPEDIPPVEKALLT